MSLFFEFAVLLCLAGVVGFIGHLFRQPLIVSFLAVGILVGPSGIDILESHEAVELLAELGIAILLFVVGLKLDISELRSMGRVATITGLGQVLFTSTFGYIIARFLDYSPMASLYIAIALTFSSTIIIVKLLSDKKELDSLHGKIAIGFLIVQDIVVILMMIGLSGLNIQAEAESGTWVLSLISYFFRGVLLFAFVSFIAIKIFPLIMHHLARSSELLLLFAIAWAVVMAAVGDAMGFGKEVGAFVAGVSLASSEFREAISSRLVSVRDFLLLFFFVHLGAGIDLSLIGSQIYDSLLFSVFVLIGNPLIVLVIMGFMGYRKRTSLLAGLTVAQISEFSLIFAAMGLSLGHIGDREMGLITLVGVMTISLSTYMIMYSHALYNLISPFLNFFERKNLRDEFSEPSSLGGASVLVFGLGRFGLALIRELEKSNNKILGVDFDPNAILERKASDKCAVYGDMSDVEFLEKLPLSQMKYVISSVRDRELSMTLIGVLKRQQYQGKIVLSTDRSEDKIEFIKMGVSIVLLPFEDSADYLCMRLKNDEGQ